VIELPGAVAAAIAVPETGKAQRQSIFRKRRSA
jgi:hypothetical protein